MFSRGEAYDAQLDKLGVYRLTDQTHNGKPTWRNNHSDPFSRPQFIFYHGREEILLKSCNSLTAENGHWLIGDKHQKVGGFKSALAGLEGVPREGWLYNDGNKWSEEDLTITVTGEKGEDGGWKKMNVSVGDRLQYPDLITILSSGLTAFLRPDVLGAFRRTNLTHLGRPVWRSTLRDDRFFFYNAHQGLDESKWIVASSPEVGQTEPYLKSHKAGLTYIPARGWACSGVSGAWYEDDLLTVTGRQNNRPGQMC